MAPSRVCNRCSARQVWNPLEWAEMPRIACMATARPTMRSWRRPAQSVHGTSITTSWRNAISAISAAMRRMVAAAIPVREAAAAGA